MKNLKLYSGTRLGTRRSGGYALVSVMMISLVASMFLMSLVGLSVGLLRTEGAARQRNYALAGAEAGMDYARARLRDALQKDVLADIAPSEEGELWRDSPLPVQYIPQLGNSCEVRIRVSRVTDEDMNWAAANHSPTIPDSLRTSAHKSESQWMFGDDWQLFSIPDAAKAANKGYCWKVEVTSYCGIFATSIRSILVGSSLSADPNSQPPSPPNAPGIVANDRVVVDSLIPNSRTEVLNNADIQVISEGTSNTFIANLKSNGYLEMGAVSIVGNLVGSNPGGASQPFARGSLTDTVVHGRVETNTAIDSDTGTEILPDGLEASQDGGEDGGNVYGAADQVGGAPRQAPNDTPVRSGTDLSFPQAPLPVSTPQNASPMPSFPMSPPDPNIPTSITPNIPGGSTLFAERIDSTGAQQPLTFDAGDSPTKIYVDDPPVTDTIQSADYAINISSSMFVNSGNPNDVQIFYSGKRPVKLTVDAGNPTVSTMKLTVFAPNAAVTLQGGSAGAQAGTFMGGIVGKSVTITGLDSLRLDQDSAHTLSERLKFRNKNLDDDSAGVKPTDYRVMTWQQINGKIVPLN